MCKAKADRCPGCSRHCCAAHVRCKYGQKYFQKQQEADISFQKNQNDPHHYKWEKFVQQGSPLWMLLWVSCQSKKALRKENLTEQQLLSALSESEQDQLRTLLAKLSGILE